MGALGEMSSTFWVYGSGVCPWCHEAVKVLKSKGHRVVYIDVGLNKQFRDPAWQTVPQIFDVGYHVGGYDDLIKYLEG